jgi:hypothetical protein
MQGTGKRSKIRAKKAHLKKAANKIKAAFSHVKAAAKG